MYKQEYTVNEEKENKYCPDCPSTHDNYLCDDCPHDVIQPTNQEIDTLTINN